jgi:hypothetical protein
LVGGATRPWAKHTFVVAALAAAVLLLSGCAEPVQPTDAQVAGAWCSDDGDEVTLRPDGTFTIAHLSLRFAEILLPEEGYIDDYRIQQDYAGKVPAGASGTWSVDRTRGDPLEYHHSGVDLQLEKVGARTETDGPRLYFDGGGTDWGFAVEHGGTFWRYFDRCPADGTRPSTPTSAPTGWPKQ